MKNIYDSVMDMIGHTPMVSLKNYCLSRGLYGNIIAKVESYNPTGSIKDRASLFMILAAEKAGLLKEGGTVIEPTSGNTGIGLSMICALRKYKLILTMPDTMSVERIKLCRQYGTEVVLTDGALGMQGSIDKAYELHNSIPNSFIPQQFNNAENTQAHVMTTSQEILADTEGDVQYFVASIGSGGTITGNGIALKRAVPECKIIAVEPAGSPLLTKGYAGKHNIQGIGANFVPKILDKRVIDEILDISDADAFATAKALAKEEGILAGISSGANLYGATLIASREENKGKNIVVILPDTGMRYLSTPLFDQN